ncbi:hypothetical protein AUC49_11310 [Staphylococcus aureus]|uniref:Uncharacterized protein n=3 Tax=Staphylococcus aureus TaxID=1280 RepID=A0AAP7YTH2_STAAU|nr:Nitrogen regulation protein NIFR3 [Staphylococcus aureus subsp. aureus 71193]ALS70560.1 hypothetical protein AUC48_11470 [Staphylococcus aureus]EIA12966.1 Nitrogen regulation protein NIFR3 [Staphylococcus aureus subsp. aureus DR10]EOR49084.1 hypothetical protein M140OLGA_0639 [Staphylococcus aureus subsp. aureus 112808A]ALS73171.1 hypothetical protein AUC49_11310 [Staphylococcus aureus]
MQVGVWAPTQKLTKSQPTIMCKLGWDDEIYFAKISFLSHSLCSYPLHMYGAYLINEYHQDFKSIANFKVLNRMINVMMCYCVLFLEPCISWDI